MATDLSGETVLVTGAGRGIGAGLATAFGRAGADVAVAARTESEITRVADEIESEHGVRAVSVETDLRDVDAIDDMFETVESELGTVSVLVNNAGANVAGPPLEMDVEAVDTMLDVNVRAVFVTSQRFGRAFRESSLDTGRIINVASVIPDLGVPAMTVYGGTKGAVRALTKGFAAELADDGVTVNSVSPGLVRIDRTERVMEEHGDDLFDFDRLPVGRVGEVDDVSEACLYLASEGAAYVTGTDLLVDGGVEFTAGLYK
ncbi:SDR family NAD(P)-dependent oxidoreductase [Halogeometricum limi]|uniref:3-oxoacyl-[acyl-carrier protein] reductase n=1 Tax=Halogeometricum limi TaxID=555875 RepID=A0A1I6IBY4_9EURY|nr:SDR family oxidoreductase [Halogeometricum limi]SFR64252.1 3-oxoacyl-[acyl-carrier protein] reductase [Halogeometricum limi]